MSTVLERDDEAFAAVLGAGRGGGRAAAIEDISPEEIGPASYPQTDVETGCGTLRLRFRALHCFSVFAGELTLNRVEHRVEGEYHRNADGQFTAKFMLHLTRADGREPTVNAHRKAGELVRDAVARWLSPALEAEVQRAYNRAQFEEAQARIETCKREIVAARARCSELLAQSRHGA